MQGLLGQITKVEEIGREGDNPSLHHTDELEYRVTFKPVTVLPARSAPPEWLKDQSLNVVRRAVDPREVGRAGDGIVLTGPESVKWLNPLTVSPETVYQSIPSSLAVKLSWWKEEKAPDVTLKLGGRSLTSTLDVDGDGSFSATINLDGLVAERSAPIEVECGGMTAICGVLPSPSAAVKSIVRGRPHLSVANDWYRVDIATGTNAGGLSTIQETGRDLNHLAPPADLIQPPLEYAGQYEHFKYGFEWQDAIANVGVDVVGSRREGDAVRVTLEAVADEGKNIHTTVNYTIFDRMPLVLTQREFRRHKPKEDKPDEGKVPVDGIDSFAYSCRSASTAENGTRAGSRVFVSGEGKLHSVRLVLYHSVETLDNMRISDGWVLAEHPGRSSYMLYLTDRTAPPSFIAWHGYYELAVEPLWSFGIFGPGQSVGLTVGLAAGETAGVDARGAWVACRSAVESGVQKCAVIARLSDDVPATAFISLGDHRIELPLQQAYLSGIGSIQYASTTIEGVHMRDPFTVRVNNIAGR